MIILAAAIVTSCAAAAPATPMPFKLEAAPSAPPSDNWNLFPDPTTGNVDIYHKGEYAGSVTGKEPKDEDPPIPHPVAAPSY